MYVPPINGGASFRWSFGPHSTWGSIESATILTTHPSLIQLGLHQYQKYQYQFHFWHWWHSNTPTSIMYAVAVHFFIFWPKIWPIMDQITLPSGQYKSVSSVLGCLFDALSRVQIVMHYHFCFCRKSFLNHFVISKIQKIICQQWDGLQSGQDP